MTDTLARIADQHCTEWYRIPDGIAVVEHWAHATLGDGINVIAVYTIRQLKHVLGY